MNQFVISSWDFSQGEASIVNSFDKLKAECWYHCQRDHDELKPWLAQQMIPAAMIESLLANDTRPRFEQFAEDCFLIILRGINLNHNADPDDMLSLRILWFRGTLISTRKIPSRAVNTLIGKLENGQGPNNLSSLLLEMTNGVNTIIAEFLTPVEEHIDHLESSSKVDLAYINTLHSRLLRLRRYLKPQRYVFEDLIAANVTPLSYNHNHFKNSLDTVIRLNESIEFYLEQISVFLSSISQLQAERMNRNTYLFSVVAGLFLPAGFFTGLLGVNIGGIPGVDNPWAFTLFCIALFGIVAVEVLVLKKLKFI
ncbi:CorA family divalent cation transporter [Vibrio breoganii]